MGIYALSVDIGPGDHRPVRSIYTDFIKEVRRGRRPDQISVNGSLIILHTPEAVEKLLDRIVTTRRLDPAYDRVSVIDFAARKIMNWGQFDQAMRLNFPLLVSSMSVS